MPVIGLRMAAWRAVARRDQDGQGLAEYAMMLALIAMVVILALVTLGADIAATLMNIGDTVAKVGSQP